VNTCPYRKLRLAIAAPAGPMSQRCMSSGWRNSNSPATRSDSLPWPVREERVQKPISYSMKMDSAITPRDGITYRVQGRLSLRIEGPTEVQSTSTNTSETSSEIGPLRHAPTMSRIPSIISLKGRSAASRTNSRRPVTPSISSRELKTSVIPSE
jgi:hypothetical protein